MVSAPHEEIACKTIDGIVIRGWLFRVAGPAPAIIMSHGVRGEHFSPDLSYPTVHLQKAGRHTVQLCERNVAA